MPDGQPALDPGDVVAQPPGGTRPEAAATVPGVELGRALAHRVRRRVNRRAPSPKPAVSVGSRGSRSESSTAAVSSELCVHDRVLKLSLPTAAQTSSMMQTLECT
jgi:hypothetical protein